MRFQRVAQGHVAMQAVAVAASLLLDADHAAVLEIPDNFLHGALGDTDHLRHVTQTGIRITREHDQHVTVITEEGPLTHTLPPGPPGTSGAWANYISCLRFLQTPVRGHAGRSARSQAGSEFRTLPDGVLGIQLTGLESAAEQVRFAPGRLQCLEQFLVGQLAGADHHVVDR